MNKIINRPHLLFFGLVPLFILISFLRSNANFDINIHDTYFVIGIPYLCYISAAFFLLIGINYYLLYWSKKPHRRALTSMHIIFQLISLLFYIYSMFAIPGSKNLKNEYPSSIDENGLFAVSFILFLIATIIHFINFFLSLIAKRE